MCRDTKMRDRTVRTAIGPILVLVLVLVLGGCGTEDRVDAPMIAAGEMSAEHSGIRGPQRLEGQADTLQVNTSRSVVAWSGTKLWGRGGHTGTVPVESGWIARRGDLLVGGWFVIDMTSIRITDIPPDQPEPIELLTSHLEDPLFFHVDKFPQASFELLGSEKAGYENLLIVDGLMTIRGVTRPIQIPVYVNSAGTGYRSQFSIDRFDWNVAYKGGFGATRFAARNFVDRDIELDITLEIEE